MPDKCLPLGARIDDPTLHPLTVPLAVQEYIDHQLRLASKETQSHRQLAWRCADLRNWDRPSRLQRKAQLCQRFPGMIAGRHWELLDSPEWFPVYIVQATIPRDELSATHFVSDLEFCNVIWECGNGALGFSIYSNHHNIEDVLAYLASDVFEPLDQAQHFQKPTHFSLASRYLLDFARKSDLTGAGKHLPHASLAVRFGSHVGNCKRTSSNKTYELEIIDYTLMPFKDFKEQGLHISLERLSGRIH